LIRQHNKWQSPEDSKILFSPMKANGQPLIHNSSNVSIYEETTGLIKTRNEPQDPIQAVEEMLGNISQEHLISVNNQVFSHIKDARQDTFEHQYQKSSQSGKLPLAA
jgi:hypothetical protein